MQEATKSSIQQLIHTKNVVMFTKTFCPYCVRAKKLLDSKGISYEEMALNRRDDGASIQDFLAEITSQSTVPNIFIKGKHFGGCDDLYAANSSGTLDALLK